MMRFRSHWLGGAGILLVALLAAWLGRRVYHTKVAPDPGQPRGDEEARAGAAGFAGTVVWSSNRSGNHELHHLHVADGAARLTRITDHPHVDTFPRFSPDGSRILFNRSREPWVSFRDPERRSVASPSTVTTRASPATGASPCVDLPGALSHEYFPRLSPDAGWLVWGASGGGHEHDRADYEIFLWKVGTPWEEAIQLTHHTGNDQWPDVRQAGELR